MLERLLQSLNTSLPILVTLAGMVIEVKCEHPLNAQLPILVTLSGIIIEAKPVQFSNVPSSIVVTLLGILIEIKLVYRHGSASPEDRGHLQAPVSPRERSIQKQNSPARF